MERSELRWLEPEQRVTLLAESEKLVKEKVEAKAIYHRLTERGFKGSYSAVYRFVRGIKGSNPDVTVRVERPPGEEVQVDFGYAGKMSDPETGKLRRTWAFVMTLSWSRHQYVEFVFDQKIETWLRGHRNAFAFFNGVTQRVVITRRLALGTVYARRATQQQVIIGLMAAVRPIISQNASAATNMTMISVMALSVIQTANPVTVMIAVMNTFRESSVRGLVPLRVTPVIRKMILMTLAARISTVGIAIMRRYIPISNPGQTVMVTAGLSFPKRMSVNPAIRAS